MLNREQKTYLLSIAGATGLLWLFATLQFSLVYDHFAPRMLLVPTLVGLVTGGLLGRMLVFRRRLADSKRMLEAHVEKRTRQLAIERDRLQRLIHAMPDAVFFKDGEGRWQLINGTAEQRFGLADTPWQGLTDLEVAKLRPDLAEILELCYQHDRQTWEMGELTLMNIPVPGNEGKPDRFFEIRKLPLFNPDGGRGGMIVIGRDITEEKQAHEAAQRHHQNQALLLKAVGDGVYGIDSAGNCTFVNEAALKMLGFTEAQVIGQDQHVLFHHSRPDGQPYPHEECPIHQTLKDGRKRQLEDWFIRRDGEFFPVELTITPVHSGEHGAVVVFRDITERRRNQEDLRIASVAFEHMQPVIISDRDQRIVRVNEAFEDMTGYRAEEVIGKTPRILRSGHHPPEFYQKMWAQILRDGHWQGEIKNRRKDGGIYAEWLNITAVHDEAGAITHYVGSVHDLSEQKKAQEEIEKLAFYDPLTGLPNRRLLKDRLRHTMAAITREDRHGALLFIDLDNFKTLNDTRGHAVGDLLLEQVAARLECVTRESDTVARLGGDEFVVLLSSLAADADQAETDARHVADKVLAELSRPYELAGHRHNLTPSIGVSLFHDHDVDADQLLKQADIAMYQAKDAGRNTVRFFDPATQARLEEHVRMELELRQALESRQLDLALQPIVNGLGQIVGAEVLARWPRPDGQSISPARFIPLAEQTGLIIPLGNWVMESACEILARWKSTPALTGLDLSVNVSARQMMQDSCSVNLKDILTRHGAPPERLKLEITETTMMSDKMNVVDIFVDLCEQGVRISLDDFGTGYSSLSYLKRLPLAQLKIDKSFVRDITTDRNDAAIVETIIAMARALDLGVVAEGVETREQFDFLWQHHCDLYQGYLFHRPMPVTDFEALLRDDTRRG